MKLPNNYKTPNYIYEMTENQIGQLKEEFDHKKTEYINNLLKEKDKEIERLNKEKDDLDDYNRHLYNENKKLNNIIDELEYFIKTYSIPEFTPNEPHREFMETKIILDKLKELKEGKE